MDWILGGVSTAVPRNAGIECSLYSNPIWRLIETILAQSFAFWLIWYCFPKTSVPEVKTQRKNPIQRQLLLVSMCFILGLEIGYKITSKTVIFLLNPCHVTTAIQIYLLAAKPSKAVTALFRIQLNLMNGPVLAYLFPETDTRINPLEKSVYWIQHGMMLVVPYYLLTLGGEFNIEDLRDMNWCGLSYGINLTYHFIVLQGVSLLTHVNLDHMLCPAILDPFESEFYRSAAVVHEALLCPVVCKLYCYAVKRLNKNRVAGSLENKHVD